MSGKMRDVYPGPREGLKWYPEDLVTGGMPLSTGRVFYVDGDKTTGGSGTTWDDAYYKIQDAIDAASAGDVIYIAERTITALATDPVSYAETLIIPNSKPHLSLIGVSRGRTQGGLPQIKIGAGSTAMLDIRAPGCFVANLGFNGASSTGGGILLRDDGGTTYVAFGTTIVNCHFKNCKAHATDGAQGGAIYTTTSGGAWQTYVGNCRFYKCTGGIVITGTGVSVPQDWIIENNVFGTAANTETDVDIYVGGSGTTGLLIRDNDFTTVDGCAGTTGTVNLYISLAAGSTGLVAGNRFACLSNDAATELTFKASGTAVSIPTTVRMAGNYAESSTNTEAYQGIVYRHA